MKKLFWKNNKIIICSSLALGLLTITTWSSLASSTVNKTSTSQTQKAIQYADETGLTGDPLATYGYGHSGISPDYIPWNDNNARRISDIFPQTQLGLRMQGLLAAFNPSKQFDLGINSAFTKADLANIRNLNLSNLNLNNFDEIFNPALIWTNLTSIDLSNNDLSHFRLKFSPVQMPNLYQIIVKNAKLNEMVDVSSYVKDPFDQASAGTTAYNDAKAQYTKPIHTKVPRYFDLANNNIPQIPKYYLKISLAYFNLNSNKLGEGTTVDPQGVYAIPWYSMASSTNTNTIGIADANDRGPYGINLYKTGEKKADGQYTYSDEVVARWRAQPYPIKNLRFENYNWNNTQNLDTGVNFPRNDDSPATGGSLPFFNFGNNQLVNIPIYKQKNVNYDDKSIITPQNKSAYIFSGIKNFTESKYYQSLGASDKPEMWNPQPDMIYPINAEQSWTQKTSDTGYGFFWNQAMQGVYYSRSFNGIDQFKIQQDSRSSTPWDNSISSVKKSGRTVSWTVPTVKASETGTWAALLNSDKFFGLGSGAVNFATSESGDYWTKWLALRSFIVSPKTFSKKSTGEVWNASSEVDANLFFDDGAWSGSLNRATTFPNNNSNNSWFSRAIAGSQLRSGGSGKFGSYKSANDSSYVLGLVHGADFSNLTQTNGYGIAKGTPTPFKQSLNVSAPQYNYDANYNVVDEIASDFLPNTGDSNFVTNISTDDAPFKSNLQKYFVHLDKDGTPQPMFPEAITSNDIKLGVNTFWKTSKQFDQAYMNVLKNQNIKMNYDSDAGTLTYSFRVYSPGYSTLGRLFKNGDANATADNNATPTLDFWVTKTISGFAKTVLQMKNSANTLENVKNLTHDNDVITQPAPGNFLEEFKNKSLSEITSEAIGKQFQTTYLGNFDASTLTSAEIEAKQGQSLPVNSKWIQITNRNSSNGTISFKIDIPDFKFLNGQTQEFPQEFRNLTFTWTGFPKATLSVIGKQLLNDSSITSTPFNVNSFHNDSLKNLFNQYIKSPASEMTAAKIFSLNPITSNRADWGRITASNFASYISLAPNNALGTLVWNLNLPGDANSGLNPLNIGIEWDGFSNKSTKVEWKSATDVAALINNKTPNEIKTLIQAQPNNFLNITNPSSTMPLSAGDLDFSTANWILNSMSGTVLVSGISLKNYFANGVLMTDGLRPNAPASTTKLYMSLPVSPTYQGQKAPSNAKFKSNAIPTDSTKFSEGSEAIIKYILDNNLYTPLEQNEATNVPELVRNLSATEIKALLVRNNVSPTETVLTLTNAQNSNLGYANNELKDSLTADALNGTLTFNNLTVKNWINKGSNTPVTKTLENHVYNFKKLSTSFVWADQAPEQIASLSYQAITKIFSNVDPEQVSTIMDLFNVGQKYYDNDGKLLNVYTIDPSKIEVNGYLGTLKFQAGAVKISNWVTNGVLDKNLFEVATPKTYNLGYMLETAFSANTNLALGVSRWIQNWVQFYYDDNYNSADATTKAQYDRLLGAFNYPSYAQLSAQEALNVTQNYITKNNLGRISDEDLELINQLKQTTTFATVDFSDYFYVPGQLLFLTTPNNVPKNQRTFAIAKTLQKNLRSDNSIELNQIYLVNYYQDGKTSMRKVNDRIFSNFSTDASSVQFKKDTNNPQSNLLAKDWEGLRPSEIKSHLDALTTNRLNPNLNKTDFYLKTRSEWVSTFEYFNIPYNGAYDLTIAYPLDIEANDYQHILIVKKLLFPFFSRPSSGNTSPIVQNQIIDVNEIWKTDAGFDSFIAPIINVNDPKFNLVPSQILTNLNIQLGDQTSPQATWTNLVNAGILTLNGGDPPINEVASPTNTPRIEIGNVSVNDAAGTITFSSIKGFYVWVNGQQSSTATNLPDVVLQFPLLSTRLVKNVNKKITEWLLTYTNQTTISGGLLQLMENLYTGKTSIADFNKELNKQESFLLISNPFQGNSDVSMEINPNKPITESVKLDFQTGSIILANLEILNGYYNNVKVNKFDDNQIYEFNLGWDYTTSFKQEFEQLLQRNNLLGTSPETAEKTLLQNNEQLMQALTFQKLNGQIEKPTISLSSNPILGQLTFNVSFQNFYRDGENLGARTFNYTFTDFYQTLPIILGSIGGVIGLFIILLLAWRIWRHLTSKEKLMIRTNKKTKGSK